MKWLLLLLAIPAFTLVALVSGLTGLITGYVFGLASARVSTDPVTPKTSMQLGIEARRQLAAMRTAAQEATRRARVRTQN